MNNVRFVGFDPAKLAADLRAQESGYADSDARARIEAHANQSRFVRAIERKAQPLVGWGEMFERSNRGWEKEMAIIDEHRAAIARANNR